MVGVEHTVGVSWADLEAVLRTYVDPSVQLEPSTHVSTGLGLDSITLMELVAELEETFDVRIPEHSLRELETLGDVLTAINQPATRTSPP